MRALSVLCLTCIPLMGCYDNPPAATAAELAEYRAENCLIHANVETFEVGQIVRVILPDLKGQVIDVPEYQDVSVSVSKRALSNSVCTTKRVMEKIHVRVRSSTALDLVQYDAFELEPWDE